MSKLSSVLPIGACVCEIAYVRARVCVRACVCVCVCVSVWFSLDCNEFVLEFLVT